MNDINNPQEKLQNKGGTKTKKNITDRTESAIKKSLSETPLTLDQKMDKLTDGIQNMANGVNQVFEVLKQMMKVQIETTNTTNKMIGELTKTMNTMIEGQENMIQQSI